MAKKLHPGQRNSLDALCRRYDIDNSHRELHGALLDSEILAEVYLAMTGGQRALLLDSGSQEGEEEQEQIRRLDHNRSDLRIVRAEGTDLESHNARLDHIEKSSGDVPLWRKSSD